MAATLTEVNKLSRNMLMAGVAEETVEEDTLLDFMMFDDLMGHTQVNWNRENSLGSDAVFRGINEEIAESAPTYSNQSATLKRLSTRIELDNFLMQTKNAVQDVTGTQLATKAKAMWRKFHSTFYYGDDSADPESFDGLHNLVTSGQTVNEGSGSTGGALALANLDTMINRVKPGKPDILAMNRNMVNRLSAPYLEAVHYNIDRTNFGSKLPAYADIPIVLTDWLTQTETIASGTYDAETGGATTSIFAVRFGKEARVIEGTGNVFNNNGVLGIQSGDMRVGAPVRMEKKDGISVILSWYVTVILGSTLSLARIDGITNAAVTV